MSSEYQIGHEGEFSFRGHTLDELQEMELEEVAELLPARQRRSIVRGLTEEKHKLLEKKKKKKNPEMVGLTFAVHDGQNFERVKVEPEMLGHYLGEFQLTRSSVEHGQAGIGATRSSKFVPLK